MRPLLTLCVAVWACGCSPDSDVSRALGGRCDAKEECDEMCLPDGQEFPGGFCSQSCLQLADCPVRAVCVGDGTGGVCLFDCTSDASCEFLGQGWNCRSKDALPDGEVMACIGDD